VLPSHSAALTASTNPSAIDRWQPSRKQSDRSATRFINPIIERT
jgi:hypothetical protein